MKDQIVEWAKELQSLAQAGLFYGRDVFDKERYQRIREIAVEMLVMRTDLSSEKITSLFCGDAGYQTQVKMCFQAYEDINWIVQFD